MRLKLLKLNVRILKYYLKKVDRDPFYEHFHNKYAICIIHNFKNEADSVFQPELPHHD